MPASHPSSFQLTSNGAFRIYDTEELLRMPAPTWLIQHVLPTNGLIGIYGPPGSYKSFVALDMAMSVGAGIDWQDKPVEQGFALYVSGEGTAGIGERIQAWLLTHKLKSSDVDIGWLPEGLPIYAGSADLDTLFKRFEEIERHPSLIILDTMARCFEGNENETQDMGAFIKGVDRFRRECHATVVVIHHTNADGSRERGSIAFKGAVDTLISVVPGMMGEIEGQRARRAIVRPTRGVFGIECVKQKEAADFTPGVGRFVPMPPTTSGSVTVEWLSEDEIP